MRQNWVPMGRGGGVGFRVESRGSELVQEVSGSCIGEAYVGAGEILVEDRRVEEARHLLFFDGVARESENVAAAGKNGAGDFVIQRGEKNQFALIEGDFGIAATQLYVMLGFNLISGSGVEAQGVEGIVELMGGARC